MVIMKIYERRVEQNISLRNLSRLSGVSFPSINKIENGKQSPTLATLELIAAALHCKVSDLFDEVYI